MTGLSRMANLSLLASALGLAQSPPAPVSPSLPGAIPLVVPLRVGETGSSTLTLQDMIQHVLANDRDLEVSRIVIEEAGYNLQGAKGYFDPRLGLNAFREKTVTPVSSIIGGAANGKLTQKQWYADPQLSGLFPALGGSYRLDFTSSRLETDSQFVTLNPQYPSALTLNLTQPLWRGLRFDENRYRILVARKNQELSNEQLRQRVTEVVTQGIQAYWELDFAYRNLEVQIEAVHLAEQQDASNRRQVNQGLLAPVDVSATQTQVQTFQQNVFSAQEILTRAENSVKALMLADRTDPLWSVALIPGDRPNPSPAMPALDAAVTQALKLRPELAETAISIEENKLDTRLALERAKPQIDAVATLGAAGLAGRQLPPGPNPFTAISQVSTDRLNALSALAGLPPLPAISLGSNQVPPIFLGSYGQSVSTLAGGSFPTARVGVQMSLPLRNRTAEAQAAISRAEGRRLHALRQQAEMAIEADVRNALQALSSARARLEAAGKARQSAEDQYGSEQRQFQAGTSTVFLVLQRQADLIGARTREIRARADLGNAAANLDRAMAKTIENQNIQVGKP